MLAVKYFIYAEHVIKNTVFTISIDENISLRELHYLAVRSNLTKYVVIELFVNAEWRRRMFRQHWGPLRKDLSDFLVMKGNSSNASFQPLVLEQFV